MKRKERKISAVMTVEASLVLPIFLLLFMNLLSLIEVHRIHGNVAVGLWEAGREAAKNAYLAEAGGEIMDTWTGGNGEKPAGEKGMPLSSLLTSVSVQRRIAKNLQADPVWEKIVAGKRAGFLVLSEVGADGTIRIDCSYQVHPLFASLTPVLKRQEKHYYGHAWIGYVHGGSAGEQEEIYVYIAKTGTVYHRNRGCSYLNPSIKSVGEMELKNLRNEGGGIYYACPLCDGRGTFGTYYVTDYGTNYHTSVVCSGLKRTVYEVKLSEVGDRHACSKCGEQECR